MMKWHYFYILKTTTQCPEAYNGAKYEIENGTS